MQNTATNRAIDTDSIRLKAYELWISGGRREGVEVQNWLEAERILRSTEGTISTYTGPVGTQTLVSAPKATVSIESEPRVQSAPPLGLTELSATNRQNKANVAKGGAGRKR